MQRGVILFPKTNSIHISELSPTHLMRHSLLGLHMYRSDPLFPANSDAHEAIAKKETRVPCYSLVCSNGIIKSSLRKMDQRSESSLQFSPIKIAGQSSRSNVFKGEICRPSRDSNSLYQLARNTHTTSSPFLAKDRTNPSIAPLRLGCDSQTVIRIIADRDPDQKRRTRTSESRTVPSLQATSESRMCLQPGASCRKHCDASHWHRDGAAAARPLAVGGRPPRPGPSRPVLLYSISR